MQRLWIRQTVLLAVFLLVACATPTLTLTPNTPSVSSQLTRTLQIADTEMNAVRKSSSMCLSAKADANGRVDDPIAGRAVLPGDASTASGYALLVFDQTNAAGRDAIQGTIIGDVARWKNNPHRDMRAKNPLSNF